jgi:hypothetical protein
MKFKSVLLTVLAALGLTAATMAQVPNYMPTNGLVGWWPFNGNANDESGNGNNGIINGSILTSDRFGTQNAAFSFNGLSDYIEVPDNNSLDLSNNYTFSVWIKLVDYSLNNPNEPMRTILGKPRNSGGSGYSFRAIEGIAWNGNSLAYTAGWNNGVVNGGLGSLDTISLNIWTNVVFTYDGVEAKLYKNGNLSISDLFSFNLVNSSQPLYIGMELSAANSINNRWFKGQIDDIGIWNRALTQQEITDLYNAVNCANNTTITPQTNSLATGNTASFTAITSDPSPSYVWQSDLGQGFQTLNNFGNYSGVNSTNLNIANVQLSEHNQQIRVITTSGNCIDTSNVAVISILDTCITNITIYDTLLTAVTDTLVINAIITGINPPNNQNTLKVFPNPANTHITIDYGNFNTMSGYTITIVNSLGQTVFTTPINQQTSFIDLSTWTGNGIYFVQLIDPQNNTIENRKIVIQ